MINFSNFENKIGIEKPIHGLGIICLLFSIYLVVNFADSYRDFNSFSLTNELKTFSDEIKSEKIKQEFDQYTVIINRNIFGYKEKNTTNSSTTNEPNTKPLNLKLIGASVTQGAVPFAIIEDSTKKTQDIFEINDKVFDQAVLVEIAPEEIKVDYNGKIETLSLELTSSGASSGSSDSVTVDGDSFNVPEQELTDALANLPRLLSEARAVPYFRNGKSIGMRLFAIRRGSLYEKVGLQNGDILKSVNGQDVGDPAEALKLFEMLKNERSIKVQVERAGADRQLQYSIQ